MNVDIINNYYSNQKVMFEIVKCLKDKEVSILGDMRVRCIIASQYIYLQNSLQRYDFFKTINNLYYSLANFDWKKMKVELGFNAFSYNPEKRREQMDLFNQRANEFIKSYDLGIDFDNHDGNNYEKVYSDCSKLKSYFDCHGVCYSLKTSGSGFHIEVKSKYLPKTIKEITDIQERVKKIGELMTDIKLILELDTMDVGETDNIEIGSFYEPRRIFKVPYSLDYKTRLVALPLSDEQFIEFKNESNRNGWCNPEFVLNHINLFNRGILERKGSSEGFDNFLKEVIY